MREKYNAEITRYEHTYVLNEDGHPKINATIQPSKPRIIIKLLMLQTALVIVVYKRPNRYTCVKKQIEIILERNFDDYFTVDEKRRLRIEPHTPIDLKFGDEIRNYLWDEIDL